MSKRETALGAHVMLALSELGAVLFRNATTQAWVGRTVYHRGRDVSLADASRISAGLCVGSSDLIGWTHDGRFLAVELKTGRVKVTPEQQRFTDAVNRAGGVGIIAYTVESAVEQYKERVK